VTEGTPPLRGRDAEIAAVRAALARAADGAGSVLLLEGAAGAGKSRKFDEAAALTSMAGIRTAIGGAEPDDRTRPLGTLLTAFRAGRPPIIGPEAHELYDTFAVPASGVPLFQAAAANLNSWTEAKADHHPQRGPLLIIQGIGDNTSPPAINEAAFKLQQKNPGVTEIASIENRGHSITIDSGWREVCETALTFIKRFA
jgi:predicted ATPase